jgi:heme/copper-type cytochrome/quinol oxidase subunit 2
VGAATTAATIAGADVRRRARVLALLGAAALAVPGPSPAAPAGATIELRVSRAGFSPARLSLDKGEAVQLVLTASDGEHCFAVDELRIEKRVVPGRPTRFDLVPDRAGTFAFYCCLESGDAAARERGELTVSE